MGYRVLTPEQVEQFVEEGFTLLRQAFAPEAAARGRAFLWEKMGLSPDDAAGWTEPAIHLHETYSGLPFSECLTPRLYGAFDDLLGEGRWLPQEALGWWPISFPGFETGPWQPPTEGWHVDGAWFHHHVNSREQGLLPIFIFSDIGPGDGGTALCPGSHRVAARLLAAAEPEGLTPRQIADQVAAESRPRVVEANGQAGDVVLLHPFMAHARSANIGSSVRFICNPCIQLKEAMNLARVNPADYSPVERAIVAALETAPAS